MQTYPKIIKKGLILPSDVFLAEKTGAISFSIFSQRPTVNYFIFFKNYIEIMTFYDIIGLGSIISLLQIISPQYPHHKVPISFSFSQLGTLLFVN